MWYIGHDFYCDILLMTLCFYFVKQHYHSEHFINKRKEITVNNINIQTCFHVQAAWKQHGPKHPQHQLPTLSNHFSKRKPPPRKIHPGLAAPYFHVLSSSATSRSSIHQFSWQKETEKEKTKEILKCVLSAGRFLSGEQMGLCCYCRRFFSSSL